MEKLYLKSSLITLILLFFSNYAPLYSASVNSINRDGVQLGKKKLYREATNKFNRAISKSNKQSARAFHNRGWAMELTGNLQGAIESYKEAFQRNPNQIVSGEKLGFLYYKTGKYIKAVDIGERVLKLDPENREVSKWLPDAYMKKLEQERLFAAEKKKQEEEKKKKAIEDKRKEEEKKKKESRIIYATFDFMIRTGYYFRGNTGYRYINDPGLIMPLPYSLFIQFTPIQSWAFTLLVENPFLGTLTPNVLSMNETLEATYKLGNFMLGIGLMLNHYRSNISFSKTLNETDLKIGIIFGYKKDKMEMKFTFYPRLLPHDGSNGKKETFDVDYIAMNYVYTVSSELKYYSIISARDFFVYDHTNEISNYWGVYEIGIGVTLGMFSKETNKMSMAFTIEFKEKLYTRDLQNTEPYKYFNGKGWLGMNTKKWFKGDAFSGFRGFGHQLTLKVQENINQFLFLYQALIFEMGDLDEDHHEFNFQVGVGVTY